MSLNNPILIVDDDADMRDTVRALLEADGFCVEEACSTSEMQAQLGQRNFSLILLDQVMPGEEDGISALRRLSATIDIPIVMLTGKDDIIDKVVGLELGADDYITKPFHGRELIARIKNVLRRRTVSVTPQKSEKNTAKELWFGGWKLDQFARKLGDPEGINIPLTNHEYSILEALVMNAGDVLSRDQLLCKMSPSQKEWSPLDRSLDVMIAKVRKKLCDDPKDPRFIRTIRQTGYMFIAEVESK